MCGIAGIMTRDGGRPCLDALDRMTAAIAHRGPDGSGRHVGRNVAMVNTRLAIIDLETGDQPLYDASGTALVANGEIYNYVELRAAMPEVAFATRSDCEPPLHLYAAERARFAERLRGMYAIAIHDPARDRLVLARDPFGIKPLYYADGPKGFAFASEPEALVAGGFASRALRPEAEVELLQLQFTTGAETIWRDIRRVLPGETVVLESGRVVERHRLAALPDGPPEPIGEREALAALDRVLTGSVDVHRRSDVDYGMFLSGGVDSAALLSLMARLETKPVRAYTIGFEGASVADERAHARRVAATLGAEHVEVGFGERDFWELLPAVASAMDDPAADYATLPSWKLAAVAARDLKVVLTGEGGDELFAGYGRYRAVVRPWWRGGRPPRAKGMLHGLDLLREEPGAWREGIVAAEAREARGGRTRLQVAQAVDCADWLPADLLMKLDRTLMAHGLEGRTPLLDPEVARLALRLPDELKVRGRQGKWLLKTWLAERLPEAEPFAAKRGFTVPVGEWIRARGPALAELVAAEPGVERLCRPEAVRRVFAATSKRAGLASWILLFYALWHRAHALGLPPEGDALETLAARP